MISLYNLIKRNYIASNPPLRPKDPSPIKFGILGAANIAPNALITPVSNHPEAVIYAVAARAKDKAEAYAKKHEIEQVYYGANAYQELLDDPEIDAIYNPLPNGLHFEWTMKALTAGKHVLVEKPSANTAEETRTMFELAEHKGLVLLEAVHYRFHPAIQRVKFIIDSGELGAIKNVTSFFVFSKGIIANKGDIRRNYGLGGGVMMDLGSYSLNCIRYLMGTNPTSVLSAKAKESELADEKLIDLGMTTTLAFPNNTDATGTIICDFEGPKWGPFGLLPAFPDMRVKVTCENGEIEMFNFVMPFLYHWIRVQPTGKKERIEKVYKPTDVIGGEGAGEDWWTTYRYQLEAFVDRAKGRTPQSWMNKEESIENILWIEEIYKKTGLGPRPKSTYVH